MNDLTEGKSAPHQVHHWSGSPFEIGLQHGRALRDQIRSEYEPALHTYVQQSGQSEEQILNRVARHLEPIFQHYVPRAVEEIHGLAEGSELSFERAFFAATRDGLSLVSTDQCAQSEGACTSLVCGKGTTRSGGVLIGQTKDTNAPLDRYHIMRFDYSDGQRLILLNYPGWCANIALTSDGLSSAGNSLYAEGTVGETLPFSLLKRLVLEKKSVLEVLACLDGLVFKPGCLILADASGHAVCLEIANGHIDVRDISGKAFGHTNSVLAPNLKEFETSAHFSSELRQKRVQCLLDEKNGDLTSDELQKIFADHNDYPYSICRHPAHDEPSSTTAAFIADLENLEMRIAIGNPCVAPFRTYSLHEKFR